MTYWMSMNLNVATTGLTPSNTDWLELEIPAGRIGVRPCGYSIQLGRSTVCPGGLCSNPNWEVSLVKPTEWELKAGASKANTATHVTLDVKNSASPYAVTGWKPPCNQRRDQSDCGPSQFPIGQSAIPVTPFRYFKITFTADNTASLLASSLARGQVIVQDIHLKEAYATIQVPGQVSKSAAKNANGDLALCNGGTVQSAATSLKACMIATAALASGAARQAFKFDFTSQTCTSGVSVRYPTASGASGNEVSPPNTVCYL
jgi:hypothetical protein